MGHLAKRGKFFKILGLKFFFLRIGGGDPSILLFFFPKKFGGFFAFWGLILSWKKKP